MSLLERWFERVWSSLSVMTTTTLPCPGMDMPHYEDGDEDDLVGGDTGARRLWDDKIDSPYASELPDGEHDAGWETLRVLTLLPFGTLAWYWSNNWTTLTMHHEERLKSAMYKDRVPHQGLVTVLNHTSEFDDPTVVMSVFSPTLLLNPQLVRWTLAAEDQVFTTVPDALFFTLLKLLPVTRGGGIRQRNLLRAVEKLDDGGWMQLFPEGYISMTEGTPLLPMRPGVGRIALEAKIPPILMPIYVEGINKTKPPDKKPVLGKHINMRIFVGEPIDYSDVVAKYKSGEAAPEACWSMVAQLVADALQDLRLECMHVYGDDSEEAIYRKALAAAEKAVTQP